ncbi:MAG: hypothetical protein HQL39_12790 [Alphaproteobacteria bacterium]|nr:hypothetical protein [Alphaproteobacteria bacterium]MBF0374277.1 hypothetical protein [Alphaproteobacteria bacterium]
MKNQLNTQGAVVTGITLTDEQKAELAKAMNMPADRMPDSLSVVGMPKTACKPLGIDPGATPKFSPALIMM